LSLSEATDDESADLWLLDTPDISITATAPALCRTRPVTTWKAWNRLGQQWSKPRAHARCCVRAAVRRRGRGGRGRRDQEAGQARLMIAELVTDRALYQEWGVTDDLSRAVVRNHSDAPVFNAIVKKEPNPVVACHRAGLAAG
jgi:hypothetical protein